MLTAMLLSAALCGQCENGVCRVPVVAIVAEAVASRPFSPIARIVKARPVRRLIKAQPVRRILKARPVRRAVKAIRRR